MNKQQIGIVGAGNMGIPIAWAMNILGYDLVILDQNEQALFKCKQYINTKRCRLVKVNNHQFINTDKGQRWRSAPLSFDHLQQCSTVISSLPYHQNIFLAKFCIDNQINYLDLGGSVSTSSAINSYAFVCTRQTQNAPASVMTDLGLAPGWVNLIAESLYQEYVAEHNKPPTNIQMMVGGLPQHPTNTLKYGCTWSYDGLLNEYRDNCIALINGEQITVNGMGGYQCPIDSEIGPLEAFYTSGGAAHTITTMQKRGVLNCSYKTLRYPQHHRIVNFLINESGLDDQSIIKIFKRTCPPQDDLVIIQVRVNDLDSDSLLKQPCWFEKTIKSDSRFSAMQKATAFPIASVAHTVTSSDLHATVLKYDDIPYPQFNKWLTHLFKLAI